MGDLARAGAVYTTEAITTLDHDYPSWATGRVIPHGIYDVLNNRDHINLGHSCDTATFACDSFARYCGGSPDVIFECVGVPGLLQECIALARPRSKVVVVGVCMQPDNLIPGLAVIKELSLQFVVAYYKRDFDFTIAMLEQSRVASLEMVTDIVGFDGFSDAFEALRNPTHQCKIILEP